MYISSGRVVPTLVQNPSSRGPGVVGCALSARSTGSGCLRESLFTPVRARRPRMRPPPEAVVPRPPPRPAAAPAATAPRPAAGAATPPAPPDLRPPLARRLVALGSPPPHDPLDRPLDKPRRLGRHAALPERRGTE